MKPRSESESVRKSDRGSLGGLFLDLAVWLLAPAIFLCWYVVTLGHPLVSVLHHLRPILLLFVAIQSFRLVLVSVRLPPAFRLSISAIVAGTALCCLLAYYSLVVIGLYGWGRVISVDLLVSYTIQLFSLWNTVGISPFLGVTALACIYLGSVLCTYFHIRKYDWPAGTRSSDSPLVVAAIAIAGMGVAMAQSYEFLSDPPVRHAEPLSLTLFAERAAAALQSHSLDPYLASTLDEQASESRRRYIPSSPASLPNIVFVVVDALRPDHMSAFGYERQTTPQLDRLIEKGKLRAKGKFHALCAESACGLLALSASIFPHQFSTRPFTLQEVLRLNGYEVHMILGGDHTNFYRLDLMYGEIESYFDASMQEERYINDDRVVLDRVAELGTWDGNPVFLQFHLMSAHALGVRDPDYSPYNPNANYLNPLQRRHPEAENFYDNGVFLTDHIIAEIINDLGEKGYLEDALLVVTSDHGEALGEHGLYTHANSVYEPILRIPFLLFRVGDSSGQELIESELGSQVDIAPTLLSEIGIPAPDIWQGMPIQQGTTGHDLIFFVQGSTIGLVDFTEEPEVWKYWIDGRTRQEYVFELTSDPGERVNLVDEAKHQRIIAWRSAILPIAARMNSRSKLRFDRDTDTQN